jgi:hypothetical protein
VQRPGSLHRALDSENRLNDAVLGERERTGANACAESTAGGLGCRSTGSSVPPASWERCVSGGRTVARERNRFACFLWHLPRYPS